jgi:phosphodiesterase/alkaline phosphatase D-like protein
MAQSPGPTVTTGAASDIELYQATLNGTVNANGESTTYYFEYGTSTSYGFTSPVPPATVTGASATSVSEIIYELSRNTTYHYRLVASNASGANYGADQTFTTLNLPPAAATEPADVSDPDNVILYGTVSNYGAETTVTFEYGPTTSYGTTTTGTTLPAGSENTWTVPQTVSGLAVGTYHYRVVADNANGTTYGGDVIFTINPSAPTAVTGTATNIADLSATLNGTVNPNGAETDVTFEYGTAPSTYTLVAEANEGALTGTTPTAVSADLIELLPNTTYYYRVVAVNSGGTTNGGELSFTTLPSPPTAVTGIATAIGPTTATLNGTVNANDTSTTVTFEYGTTTAYGSTVTADQSPVSGTTDTAVSKALSGLTEFETYHYRVVADSAGGTTYGADMTFTTGNVAPTAVTNVASGVGTTTATLNGTVNANNGSTTVTFEYGTTTSYGRSVEADQSPLSGASDTPVSRSVIDLIPATTYHYRVVAVNPGGTTYGADQTFFTQAAPSAVTNAATGVDNTNATLNGTVNANGSSSTVTFEYGATAAYGSTVAADQSPLTGNTATAVSKALSGLTTGITYHYRVVATNANGTTYGADMTFYTVTPAAPTATTNAATSILSDGATLNGTVNANNADTTVTFEYGTTVAYGSTVTADQSPVSGAVNTAVSKAISGLASGTYHYRVVAVNAQGTTYGSDMTFSTTNLPAATTNAATDVGSGVATLNGLVNANGFNATITFQYGATTSYGSTVSANPNFVSGTVDTTVTAVLSGLSPNTTYHYRVKADGTFGDTYGADMTFTTGSGPTATTNAATSVNATSATLNGTVNAAGNTVSVTFEYGLNTSYGKVVTADQSPVSGSSNTPVSHGLTSLVPNTTYHYRVVASTRTDTIYGADQSFTTSGIAPIATTEAASGVSGAGATLNGTVNAKNASTTVTFEWGTSTSYGSTVSASPGTVTGNSNTAVSAVLSGLTSGTTYHYRVKAVNSNGTTYGADMTFFTDAAGPTATTQAATNITATGATLNGTVNANNNSTTVTFEWGPSAGYGRTATADQSPVTGSSDTPVSVNLSGLVSGNTYHYRVVASSSGGTVYGADMTFFVGSTAPTVTTQAATNITATGATLNGLVNANYGDTTVTFEYGATTSYGSTVTAAQSPVTGSANTAVSFNLTALVPNTTYHYRVVGQNSVGATDGADMTFTTSTTLPTVTTGAATDIEPDSATLNGTVNANNDSTTVTFEYGLDTSYGSTVTAAQSPVTGTSDTAVSAGITGLTPDTLYHYRVVGQNSSGANNGADMTFTTLPPRTPTVTTKPVTHIGFHTAKSGGNVTDEGASPVTARGVVWSTNPNPTLADNFTVNDYGPGSFNSTMNQMNPSTTYYVRAYATNSYGTSYGEEFEFTTDSKNVKAKIVQPKDGDTVSGTVTIHATASGNSSNNKNAGLSKGANSKIAKVEFFIGGTKIAEDTTTPYKTDWDTTAYPNGDYIVKAVATNETGERAEDSVTVTVNNTAPKARKITTNRDKLVFKAVPFGKRGILTTAPQFFLIDTGNKLNLKWEISSDAGWLSTAPTSGTGMRWIRVIVNPRGLATGSYSASLNITNPANSDVMASVEIALTVFDKKSSGKPFGTVNALADGVVVNGNVPITGWALDDIEVTGIKIFREPLTGEGKDLIYLGDATLLNGARPDMELSHGEYPLNYRAGWGYLLNTNSLPGQGNGAFTLIAKAEDKEGHIVTLGTQTINVDNANAVKPFGAIDTFSNEGPEAVSFGWALTPTPNAIPIDGSTITVWVDGLTKGSPVYNQYRKDIALSFPSTINRDGAGASFSLDTSLLGHGMHTMTWSAADDAGNKNAVGFRYFFIDNPEAAGDEHAAGMAFSSLKELELQVPQRVEPGTFKKGFGPEGETGVILPDDRGIGTVTIDTLEPVQLQLGNDIAAASAYLVAGDMLTELPAGASLDAKSGTFTWIPGPGYEGKYLVAFILEDAEGKTTRTLVQFTIDPRFKKID